MVIQFESRLARCVERLHHNLTHGYVDTGEMERSLEAVLQLLVVGWEVDADGEDAIWREGYEQCLLDVVEAMASEWGVELPEGQDHASDRAE